MLRCYENACCCTYYTKVLERAPNDTLEHR